MTERGEPENPQAFPCVAFDTTGDRHWQPGMDLRDWFAGGFASAALGGLVTSDRIDPKTIARDAYEFADAMLAARGGVS